MCTYDIIKARSFILNFFICELLYRVYLHTVMFPKGFNRETDNVMLQLSLVLRKPDFGVFDQVRQKPGCAITEYS